MIVALQHVASRDTSFSRTSQNATLPFAASAKRTVFSIADTTILAERCDWHVDCDVYPLVERGGHTIDRRGDAIGANRSIVEKSNNKQGTS
jgi:hypothetical protein